MHALGSPFTPAAVQESRGRGRNEPEAYIQHRRLGDPARPKENRKPRRISKCNGKGLGAGAAALRRGDEKRRGLSVHGKLSGKNEAFDTKHPNALAAGSYPDVIEGSRREKINNLSAIGRGNPQSGGSREVMPPARAERGSRGLLFPIGSWAVQGFGRAKGLSKRCFRPPGRG